MKTVVTNPELVKVGQKCKVLSSAKWWGINTNEENVYLPAEIKEISYNETNPNIPTLILKVRYSPKYKNWPIDRLMVLSSQIRDNKETIIFT